MSEDWTQYKVASLRQQCRARNISPLPRKKNQLIAALIKYEKEEKQNENKEPNTKQNKEKEKEKEKESKQEDDDDDNDVFKAPKPKPKAKRGKKRSAKDAQLAPKSKQSNKKDDSDDSDNNGDGKDDDTDNDGDCEFREPAPKKRRKVASQAKQKAKQKSKSKTKGEGESSPKPKSLSKSDSESKDDRETDDDESDEANDETKEESDQASRNKNKNKNKNKDKGSGTSNGANTIKIVCYNLNGVRAAARNGLEKYLASENGDIVCFSEMKADFKTQNPCSFDGYQIIWNDCTEKKGYAGSCILTKLKPVSIAKGIGCEDAQGRAVIVEFDKFYVVNTYVPNSGQRLKFEKRRRAWDVQMKQSLQSLQDKKPVIWTGDLNVAVEDWDVYDGTENKARCKTAGFTPYERANFRGFLKDLSMVDSWRHLYPDSRSDGFTFFTARGKNMKKDNKGWRLDYFVVSEPILPLIQDITIQREIACSDHVPLVLTLKNPNESL